VFRNITAGLSGPAIKPIALRMVWDVARAMRDYPEAERIPIIGLGGIARWQDAIEFIYAGASAVQVGTAEFANPLAMVQIIDGLETFMRRKGYGSVTELRGRTLESVYR
jgi:dihydroorotate dehydrogenase (NAD+) catalytic subunit